MTKEELLLIAERCREAHDACYPTMAPDYDACPMYFLIKGAGEPMEILMLAEMPEEPEMRNTLVRTVRKRADEGEFRAFAFSSEGWTLPPQSMNTFVDGERISQRADRVEVLMVHVGDRSGHSVLQTARIVRSPENAPRLVWSEPHYSEPDSDALHSRMNIFDPVIPTPEAYIEKPTVQ